MDRNGWIEMDRNHCITLDSYLYSGLLSHACSRNICFIMSAAMRVSQLVQLPLLLLAQHHNLTPHSQSAILVSWANYFTGACPLLGVVCHPVCLLLVKKLCLL